MDDKTSQRIDTIARELEKRRTEHGSGTAHGRAVRKLIRRILMLIALVSFILAGIFIFNFFRLNSNLVEGYIKQGIIPNLTQGRFAMTIGPVSGNLINGVELESVLIQNPLFKGTSALMTIPRISMKYSLWGIFWGNITLEKLQIENPVVTLKRDATGRAIWDFAAAEDVVAGNDGKQTDWQKRAAAQALADNYLTDINVQNLSILIPEPGELIIDEFVKRLVRFPTRTYQISGVGMTLKKYPADKFVSHILSITTPENQNFLRFQVTRTKQSGNFTASFDAIGQNFNLAVENLGLKGRKVNFYDGRMKDRLNLEWVIERGRKSLPEKISGLSGVLKIPDFASVFTPILALGSEIKGALELSCQTSNGKNLYDSDLELKLADIKIKLPFFPEVQGLDAEIAAKNRIAELKKLQIKIKNIESIHQGKIDYSDESNIKADLTANVMGDLMKLNGNYFREKPGLHRLSLNVFRNSGQAKIDLNRQIEGKSVVYRDFKIEGGLEKDGRAVDILPLNILPDQIGNQILAWFTRIDLIGPLKINTSFPTIDDWKNADLDFSFNGARIVSRQNAADQVRIDGGAKFSNGVLLLENLSALIDNLRFKASGSVEIAAQRPFVKSFDLDMNGGVEGASFIITSERTQKSLGLKQKPDFDHIELKGSRFFSATLNSKSSLNRVSLDLEKMRLVRRKKPLWLDNFSAEFTTGLLEPASGKLPGASSLTAAGDLFGVKISAMVKANLASGTIDELSCKGGGDNFSRILEAVVSQPEGEHFFKKYPMNIGGAFDFAFLGRGLLKDPELEGWIKFPVLNLSYKDFLAKLPFHAIIKTSDQNYAAEISAGKAFIKVKDVNFDLGKTMAKAESRKFFSSRDPEIKFSADSEIFSTGMKAAGAINLASKKINKFELNIKSGNIENLAREVARIGQFKIPFELSGKFSADASLSGNLFSPDSDGNINFSSISLDFPIESGGRRHKLTARNLNGKAGFVKRGNDLFSIDVGKISGKILDAGVDLSGKAGLIRKGQGLKPVFEKIVLKLDGLRASDLANYLIGGFLPPEYAKRINVNNGLIDGNFSLSGSSDKILALGQASLTDVSIGYSALKDRFEKVSGQLQFEGRSDGSYARIGVNDFSASFGRSKFKIDKGFIEDPLFSGKLMLEGAVEKLFPTDLLGMMGGMKIEALSFPEEGWLDGKLEVEGTLAEPRLKTQVSSSKMKISWKSDGQEFNFPIGQNSLELAYNAGNGEFLVDKVKLSLLSGSIELQPTSGIFSRENPFVFKAEGNLSGIDLSKLEMKDADSIRGIIDGKMKANWESNGSRDAVFNLNFKNLFIPKIPLVDPKTMDKVGVDFIEQPDFREGQLNFYVTTEEDSGFAGKLLIADGLFAGPHMRLELGNSEFNPVALKLSGKLMLNPQSLRHTDLGKKLGRLSATIQDRQTGIPFVDLNLSGTWDKPEIISGALQKNTEKRAKRNFIKRLFGSRGPHKASVEELMNWFPGWQKGM